jgi:hypothetical protein
MPATAQFTLFSTRASYFRRVSMRFASSSSRHGMSGAAAFIGMTAVALRPLSPS